MVFDTNVVLSALRSRQGAPHKLLSRLGDKRFVVCILVPLMLEYEATIQESEWAGQPDRKPIEDMLDDFCLISEAVQPPYLWRPVAKDPKAEMLVELAVAGECDRIITFNKRDLAAVPGLGIKLQTPKEFLKAMEDVK